MRVRRVPPGEESVQSVTEDHLKWIARGKIQQVVCPAKCEGRRSRSARWDRQKVHSGPRNKASEQRRGPRHKHGTRFGEVRLGKFCQ